MQSIPKPSLKKTQFSKKIALVDSYSFFYKAHYAFHKNPLTNKDGEVTSIIFNFLELLLDLTAKQKYDTVVCVLDSKGPTFRHKLDNTYKANRPPMPDDIRVQSQALRELIPSLGVPMVESSGFEADDIIAHYARNNKNKEHAISIYSSDKDLMQLVDEHTFVMVGDRKGKQYNLLDADGVFEKYGVYPYQMVDYLSLLGDTADNIQGVSGIGKKTACKLLSEYKTLENIYKNLENLKGAMKTKLENGTDSAIHSKKMIALNHDIAGIPALKDLSLGPIDHQAVKKKLLRYECISALEKIKNANTLSQAETRRAVRATKKKDSEEAKLFTQPTEQHNPLVEEDKLNPFSAQRTIIDCDSEKCDENSLGKSIDTLIKNITDHANASGEAFSFDLETTSLDPFAAEILAITFCYHDGNIPPKKQAETAFERSATLQLYSAYIRFACSQNPNTTDQCIAISKRLLLKFKPLFQNQSIGKVGQNLKFEYSILAKQGITLAGIAHDTMIYEYLLKGIGRLKLEDLSLKYLFHRQKSYKQLTAEQDKLALVDRKSLLEYALQDSEVTHQVYLLQRNRLTPSAEILFKTVEMPLVTTLAQMELNGISIDTDYFKQLSSRYHKTVAEITQALYEIVGESFNINSTKELQQILYGKLQIPPPVGSKNKSGHSTDQKTLERIADESGLVDANLTDSERQKRGKVVSLLLEYRKVVKLLNTYVDVLPELINPKTQKIHSSFNQTVAATGRLSSNSPNLQNIPIYKGEDRLGLRNGFVAGEGLKLVSLDYSQVELRVLAALSQDNALKQAYLNDADIHKQTASLVFAVSEQEVTEVQRNQAKTINFSVIYGISAYALANALGLGKTHPEMTATQRHTYAKNIIDTYYKSYPRVKDYMQEILAKVEKDGYVETHFGRRRAVPAINSTNANEANAAKRIAFNTVIQGTAADIIKIAMNAISQKIRLKQLSCNMLLQVHDELVFSIAEDKIDSTTAMLKQIMEQVNPFEQILRVDSSVGDTWAK